MNKTLTIIGWVLTGLLGLFFALSSFGKLSGRPEVVEGFAQMGLGDWRMIIASGEVASLVLFLILKTQSLGTLLLSSYMGGAIAFHMSVGDPFIGQSAILVAIWVASILRNPNTLSSFINA